MRLSKQVLLFAVCAGAIHAQTITRVEQNDPAVTYRGTWDTNTSAANSGALAAWSMDQAALASITFNGTGITWIGVKDPGAGIAWVYLDGAITTVDSYTSGPTLYRQPLFSAKGLAPGQHTLVIEVPALSDPQGKGLWVW